MSFDGICTNYLPEGFKIYGSVPVERRECELLILCRFLLPKGIRSKF